MTQGGGQVQDKGAQGSSRAQAYFYGLADEAVAKLRPGEVLLLSFSGEESSFIRINKAAVRQPGDVLQQELILELVQGQRHARGGTTLSGEKELDRGRVESLLAALRDQLPHLPEDPHLLYATAVRSTEHHGDCHLPDAPEALRTILETAKGQDLVGIWASGWIYKGFANSLGQRNWFSTATFNFDWSLYHQGDKAVKSAYAGFAWDPQEFKRRLDTAGEQLRVLAQEPRTIAPGHYRVYLAPSALNEFLGMICWGGFSIKAHKTKQSPLLRMVEQGIKLSPKINFRENTRGGVAANFQSSGFVKPDQVTLLEAGALKDYLVSPRSAKEYDVPTNGVGDGEFPASIELDAGDLPLAKVLGELDTGLYINNLWYLNYSDRPACRITGMTRFACFWVEQGRIAAPLNVMRFDETAFRVLGENLLGLTAEREMLLSSESYGGRSTDSSHLPGALIDDFAFTL
jgi:predicted Zn-dependent protease